MKFTFILINIIILILFVNKCMTKSFQNTNEKLNVIDKLSNENNKDEIKDQLINAILSKNSEKIIENAKRSLFNIKIYYDIVHLKDGVVMLIPKDYNKNHYFIG